MKSILLYGDFLYFPEDKSTYIPAVIELFIIILLCVAVFMIVRKVSKKQEMKTKALEEKVMKERHKEESNH